MNTHSPSTAIGDGATATLNFRGNDHSSAPSLAETPRGPASVPYTYWRTPPRKAGITEACDITDCPGFGVRQISFPVALSSATRIAAPPVATITRLASCSGFWPLYQEGMVAWYSVTRLLRQTCLPVLASRQCRTALGSSEITNRPSTAGTVRVMAWLGRISRASRYCQICWPVARERQFTIHSDFLLS